MSAHHSSSDVIAETDWRAQIKERVKAIESGQVRVMAIRISSVEEVEKKHGAVKVNDLLGAVVATVTRLLPRPAKISQVEVGQFGIVFSCGDSEIESISEEVIAALVELCREIAEFSVGIFDHRSIENVGDSRYSLDYSYAYDYALIAAAAAGENSGYTFDEQAPRIVLTKQTDADKYEQVSADYKKFKEIGIFGVDLDNQAGISYFTSGNILEANAAFRVAVEHGTDPTLRSNYAISLFYLQRFHEAYEQMRQSAQDKDHGLPSPGLIPLFAIAAFESNKRNGSPPPQEVKRLIDSALQVTSHTFGTEVKLKEVSESFSLAYPEI
ncbi:MAG: hypothetical protein EON58_08635 [Alphaproteobacteria bacterium]|nr:MAG: hypothetical protein EON58_08635 [Alphaproteobacteria bacterium]